MRQAALLAIVVLAGCATPAEDPEGGADDLTLAASDCLATLAGLDLQTATIPDLQAALESGTITSVQLVEAYELRIAAFDVGGPTVNSVQAIAPSAREQAVALDAERAAGNVRGPLHGIPILIKDNIGTFDQPNTAGSLALAENRPAEDAFLVAKLREAGAIVFGKAKLSEFAHWRALNAPSGWSGLGGQVVNAYHYGDPSGSSSGSGVAASMAFASATIGTETSGSILSPSNANSLVGVKPTTGLASRAGIIPIAASFDTPGPMTRHVVDAAIVLGTIAGPDPADARTAESAANLPAANDYTTLLAPDALRGARLGYEANDDPVFQQALTDLEALGAELVVIDDKDADSISLTEIPLLFNEFKFGINDYLANVAGPDLPVKDLTDIIVFNEQDPASNRYGQDLLVSSDATPGLWPLAEVSIVPVLAANRQIADDLFASNDVDAIVGRNAPYTGLGAAAGYPTVVVPSGYDGDEPVGLSFFGPAWSEPRLLSYAYAYEQATRARVPPTAINDRLLDSVCDDDPPSPAPKELPAYGPLTTSQASSMLPSASRRHL